MTADLPPGDWRLHRAFLSTLLLVSCQATTMTVTDLNSPKILEPQNGTINTTQGERCTITCLARTRLPQFCLVFWVVNDSFIEDVYPEGRVTEETQSVSKDGDLYQVEKSLVINSTEAEDFHQTFTCVIQDPSGHDLRSVTLVAEDQTLSRKRKRRCTEKVKKSKKNGRKAKLQCNGCEARRSSNNRSDRRKKKTKPHQNPSDTERRV